MFADIENSEIPKNNLRKIRIEFGLTITALSKLVDGSTKLVSQAERMISNPMPVTKSKSIRGWNMGTPGGEDKLDYKNVFPDKALYNFHQ